LIPCETYTKHLHQ